LMNCEQQLLLKSAELCPFMFSNARTNLHTARYPAR